jgi:hypothetical protein
MTFRGGPISAPPEPSRRERFYAQALAHTQSIKAENKRKQNNEIKKLSNEFSETLATLREIGKIKTLKKNNSMSILIKKFDKTEPTNSYLDQEHGKDITTYPQPPQQTLGYIDGDSFFISTSLKFNNYHGGGGGHIAYKLYGFIDNKFIFMNTSKNFERFGVGPGILNGHQYFMYHPLIEYTFYNDLGNKYIKLLYNFILKASKIYIKTDNMNIIFKYVYELDTKNQKKIERKQKKIEKKQEYNNFELLLKKPPYIENVNDNNQPFTALANQPFTALSNQPFTALTNQPFTALANQSSNTLNNKKTNKVNKPLNKSRTTCSGQLCRSLFSRRYKVEPNNNSNTHLNKKKASTSKFWKTRVHPNKNN